MKTECRCIRARHEHGTNRAYSADACRCAECREAHRVYASNRRRQTAYNRWDRWVNPIGSVRRIRALHALGWPMSAVAAHVGVDAAEIRRIARGVHGERMSAALAAKVIDTYDVLSMRLPDLHPNTTSRARRYAAKQGWLPPLAYDDDEMDKTEINVANAMHATCEKYVHTILPEETGLLIDEIAIQEAVAGRRVTLTRDELSGAAAILDGMGHSAEFIAERLGVAARTVVRMRGKRAA